MGSPGSRSILVVDDDSLMREMLKAILRSEEYEVVGEAANGEDAIAMCAKLKPKLVLLDINMPKMGGLQALAVIRQAQPEVKVILISADATMDNVSQAVQNGAVGFVIKPFNAARVLDKVKEHIKGKA